MVDLIHATFATSWANASWVITISVVLGALILFVVWQTFSIIKKGMDRDQTRHVHSRLASGALTGLGDDERYGDC